MVRIIKGLQHIAQIPQGNYPFWIIYSSYLRVGQTRVEIMHLNNGIGNSTTILTGANVIDLVPSKYSLYGPNSVQKNAETLTILLPRHWVI
jgi:hypothetical protein